MVVGKILKGDFDALCRKHSTTQEFTSSSSPQLNGVAARAVRLIEAAASVARSQAPILFPKVELPFSDFFLTEALLCVPYILLFSAPTSNPDSKS